MSELEDIAMTAIQDEEQKHKQSISELQDIFNCLNWYIKVIKGDKIDQEEKR